MNRNLSIHTHFQNLAARHQPRFRFHGHSRQDWRAWRDGLLPAVLATLGRAPERVPLRPETLAEWAEDGLIKQRVVFDVEAGLSVVALVYRPADAAGPLPAILACHGHGPYGKDAVMGLRPTPAQAAHIAEHNYDYGLQMARAGYVTLAIDWRGFGERSDAINGQPPAWLMGRDICNVHNLRAAILDQTLLGLDIHDARCALDYLAGLPFVDARRIGVMGLSFGGTMATWLAFCDERIRAADVICYSTHFAAFGMRDANFCGSQITPGLYRLCDVPDLQGLIAPKPLLIEIGEQDTCFDLPAARLCFAELEKIYTAAGARDRLELDLFAGGHRWGGHRSRAFFEKHLAA